LKPFGAILLIVLYFKYVRMKILFMLIIFIGGAFGYLGYKLKYTKPHYQFEKTTTGRTVKFLDYNESKRYERNKVIGILILSLSIVIFGIGLLALFIISR
jgi:hypothetical protein